MNETSSKQSEWRAPSYVRLVIGLGALTTAVAIYRGGVWVTNNLPAYIALVIGIIIAERFVINLWFNQQSMAFSVVEVALTIGLMNTPSGPFVLAAALGMMGGQIIRKRAPMKVLFNSSMYAIGAGASSTAFHLMSDGGIAGRNQWLGAIAAMAVFHSINQSILATVVALYDRVRVRDILREGSLFAAAVAFGSTVLGILAHFLYTTDPTSVVLMPLPMGLSYMAYKGWVRSRDESRKMRTLYGVGSSLMTSLGADNGLERFLAGAMEMFRAGGAQIILRHGPAALKVLDESGRTSVFEFELGTVGPGQIGTDQLVERYASEQGWASTATAQLVSEVGTTGALLLHSHVEPDGPAEFPKGDEDLLQMLANEASVAIQNSALFESVNEERRKLSDIVEHTTDGIYQVGPDRKIMTWNPAMETITGFSAVEAVGQMCFNILRARDSKGVDMCSGDCPILAASEHKCHQNREAQIMRKDGSARWISYSHSPILDHNAKMTSDVIVVRDVTKQKATQELKDDFVATVSHELRTPITPIKGFLMTLLREDAKIPESEQKQYFAMMLRQSERLERLVEDLLDASRIESGSLVVETTVVDVVQLGRQILEGYTHSNDREFRFSSSSQTVLAKANAARLEQVVTNLIENALRYTPEQEPIDLVIREEGTEVVVAVRDRGPGIPYDEQEMIFERFYRLGHHLTREQGGTGLGLYIARRLTEAMGGNLSLNSRLGQGATFLIHLKNAVKAPHDSTVAPRTI